MSKINDLIQELCPNGVEYKKLKEIGDTFTGLSGKSKDDFYNGNCRYITYTNIFNNPVVRLDLDDRVLIKDNEKQNNLKYGDILVAGSSENIEDSGMIGVVCEEPNENIYLNSFCFGFRLNDNYNKKLIPGFSKHVFRSANFRSQILSCSFGVTRYNLNKKMFLELTIPIPPLEVQEEIVRILDKFSSNGLESLLTLELELRREQYEYYLKRTFKSVSGKKVALGSVVTFNRGKRVVKKDLENDKTSNLFPVYQNSLIPLGYYDKSNFDCKKTIIISAGAAGKIGFVEEKIWAADDCLRCLCSNEILDKYLYYFLKSNESYIQSMVRRASVPRISTNIFEKMEIIIPSIDIQRKIIEIFDRFEKIINNVNDGLPAEIELRRQQYEYYRNKLLSFEELSVSE